MGWPHRHRMAFPGRPECAPVILDARFRPRLANDRTDRLARTSIDRRSRMLIAETCRVSTPLRNRQFYKFDRVTLPLRYPVRVLWGGRGPFEAALVKHPQAGAASWVTYETVGKTRYMVELPCKKKPKDPNQPWKAWRTLKGDGPDFWAPIDPDNFKLFPLPPVALILPDDDEGPRLWHEKASFDAANAAAEMEAERDQARNEGKRRRGQKRKLWWLDASQLRYSPTGKIKAEEAEARIMRALAQDYLEDYAEGLGVDRRREQKTWEELRALADMEAKYPDAMRVRFEALQQDRNDYDLAMTWFAALGSRHLAVGLASASGGLRTGKGYTTAQRVLFFASRDTGMSFAAIGKALRLIERRKISSERVRQIYKAAVDGIWIIANEFQDIGRANRAQALERLKEGNRRARGDQ